MIKQQHHKHNKDPDTQLNRVYSHGRFSLLERICNERQAFIERFAIQAIIFNKASDKDSTRSKRVQLTIGKFYSKIIHSVFIIRRKK